MQKMSAVKKSIITAVCIALCVTSRGFDAADMQTIAHCIARACRGEASDREYILSAVAALTEKYPLYK